MSLYERYNCKTWHPAYPITDSNRLIPHFEMEWDNNGCAEVTGERQEMTEQASRELWFAAPSAPKEPDV